jgi:hypothetical protein
MATLRHFSHKNPFYDWHWIYFWLPSAENSPKKKRKKCPTTQNKKVKKCRDVDPEVWWKLGGISTGLVSK